MSKTAVSFVSILVTGDGLAPLNDTGPAFTNASGSAPTSQAFTPNNFLAVTVPAGARYVKVNVPSTYAGTLKLAGAQGEVGQPIDTVNPTQIALPAANPALGFIPSNAVTLQFTWG